ncbi:hypothetical protein BHE74_00054343 [Ensete ventricosum]|nr:hypothetical protein GW17_00004429 [Ensete ventricosum]RWW40260.1 hypothetical protein BHE74_00054343 [Ensete ventricosum]
MMTGGHCERLPLVSLVAWATASIGSKQMLSLVPSPWITVYEQAASSAAQQAHLNMAWTWISSSLSWFTGTSKERNFAGNSILERRSKTPYFDQKGAGAGAGAGAGDEIISSDRIKRGEDERERDLVFRARAGSRGEWGRRQGGMRTCEGLRGGKDNPWWGIPSTPTYFTQLQCCRCKYQRGQ